MITDPGIPRLVHGTLLGTSTIIECYPLVRAFLYPPPEDACGCQRVPARCPRVDNERPHVESVMCQTFGVFRRDGIIRQILTFF